MSDQDRYSRIQSPDRFRRNFPKGSVQCSGNCELRNTHAGPCCLQGQDSHWYDSETNERVHQNWEPAKSILSREGKP